MLVMDGRKTRNGFTIVELLIVIVIIAILAAITIVAYSGIQNRARLSALQSSLSQYAKSLEVWKLTNNNQYPASLSAAQTANLLKDTADADYTTYIVNSSSNPTHYCATATNSNGTKYSVSSTSLNPLVGECVTNLVRVPQATGTSSWDHGYGTGGAGTGALINDNRFAGGVARRITWTTAPSNGSGLWIGCNSCIAGTSGQQYYFSARYTTSWAASPAFYFSSWGGVTPSLVNRGDGTYEARGILTVSSTSTSSMSLTFAIPPYPPTNATFAVGGLMAVAGSTQYAYGDGDSPGWFWNGTANNSTSTGPAEAL